MKKVVIVIFSLFILNESALAEKKPVKVSCPKVIGNLSTGEFSDSKNNYKCYKNTKAAEADGLVQALPSFSARTFTGTTDQSTDSFVITRPAKVSYIYSGDRHFSIVYRRAADGAYGGLLANGTGAASGSQSIPEVGTYYFDVSGEEGQWTITVEPR